MSRKRFLQRCRGRDFAWNWRWSLNCSSSGAITLKSNVCKDSSWLFSTLWEIEEENTSFACHDFLEMWRASLLRESLRYFEGHQMFLCWSFYFWRRLFLWMLCGLACALNNRHQQAFWICQKLKNIWLSMGVKVDCMDETLTKIRNKKKQLILQKKSRELTKELEQLDRRRNEKLNLSRYRCEICV